MGIRNKLVIYSILSVILLIYVFLWDDSEAAKHEKILQQEFRSITSLDGVKVIRNRSGHKEGQAHVNAVYFTDANYSQIKQHYDQEFKKHGWIFKGETNVTNWGRVVPGAKIVYFEKGVYQLELEYSGKHSNFTYAIGMVWGIRN